MDEFYNQTTIHPIGLAALLVLGAGMLVVPRRWTIVLMMIIAVFISPAQRLVVAGFDFNMIRIMLLFGWARVLLKGEVGTYSWRSIDTAVVAWSLVGSFMYSILWMSTDAVVNRLGFIYEALGLYFLFRILLREPEDIYTLMRGIAIVVTPVAAAFILEHQTHHNIFAIFGGVAEITWIRDGRLRCQGAFAHPLLAGCFWAALMPLAVPLWTRNKGWDRFAAVWSTICFLIIIFTCSSATPIMAVAAALFGGSLYFVRYWFRWIRWGFLLLAIALHLTMNHGLQSIFMKIKIAGGTGYHRYHLIDQAINRVGEWALMGTRSTAHWGYGLNDVTNQYIVEGVRGGLLTMGLFMLLIYLAFRSVGQALRRDSRDRQKVIMGWAVGTALFVHIINFLAVSYFGQILMLWYLQLAMVSTLHPALFARRIVPARSTPASIQPAQPAPQPVGAS